jgi:hypothetical protein
MPELLFGRQPSHDMIPLSRLARQMANSEDEKTRAIGLNLLYDHRVGEERARAFWNLANGAITAGDPVRLIDALQGYRREWIARLPGDTFEHPTQNKQNHIFDLAPETGVDPDLELAHVCNVTQKLMYIRDPDVRRQVAGLGFGNRAFESPAAVSAVLDPLRGDAVRKRRFAERFLELLDVNRGASPWHPIWAAGWRELEQVMDPAKPESWLESVGLVCPNESQWILVLRYHAGDARKLYRPTQLEAGGYAWHFPSPICEAPPLRGGHPMNLGSARTPGGSRGLLSEFVHAEIRFTPEHWVNAGSLLEPTSEVTPGFLMEQRRIHYLQLCEEYTRDAVSAWMPDPVKLG